MRALMLIFAALMLVPALALCAEGDPLLSVDELMTLTDSYEAFLVDVEELAMAKGLLSEQEREAWHDAQLGDFYQNGGYGSILINYTPGILGFVREEDTLLILQAPLTGGYTLELETMRRFIPQDSSLSGLMLNLSLIGADGVPVNAKYTFSATSGVFLKWDALLGSYTTVGANAVSDGETVVWSGQTPMPEANDPFITISITDAQTGEALPGASMLLTVDGEGYIVGEDALSGE